MLEVISLHISRGIALFVGQPAMLTRLPPAFSCSLEQRVTHTHTRSSRSRSKSAKRHCFACALALSGLSEWSRGPIYGKYNASSNCGSSLAWKCQKNYGGQCTGNPILQIEEYRLAHAAIERNSAACKWRSFNTNVFSTRSHTSTITNPTCQHKCMERTLFKLQRLSTAWQAACYKANIMSFCTWTSPWTDPVDAV